MANRVRSVFICGIVFPLIFNFSYGSDMKQTIEKTYPMESGGQISIKGDEGFIKIKSWDKNEVHLTMTKQSYGRNQKDAERQLNDLKIEIESQSDRLTIKVISPTEKRNFNLWNLLDPDTWGKSFRTASVDFELTVPEKINLALINDEGNVTVESVSGDLEIDVDEGDIHLKNIVFETASLFSDEGDIHASKITNPEGRLTVSVDEGDVTLEKVVAQRVKIECDEGNIDINGLECRTCDITTDEGDVDVTPILGASDHYYITTGEGNISFYLDQSPNVSLDLETQDGFIQDDFQLSISRGEDGQQCRQKIGTGSSPIEMYAGEGNIHIRKK
ncbi:MAG: DUF4097 family beta strand repeat-containing protein [Candidatus Zhuqueibacterota bacterium]